MTPESPHRAAEPSSSPERRVSGVDALAARERMQRIAWLGVPSWGVSAVVWGSLGKPRMAFINGLAALAWALSLAVLRRGEGPKCTRLSAHIALGSGTLALIASAQVVGQGAGIPLWYLPLVPFVAGLLGEGRAAYGWTVVAALGIVATHALAAYVNIPTEVVMDGPSLMLSQVMLVGLTFLTAMAMRDGTDAALRAVREREATIEAQSLALAAARDTAEAASRAKSEFLAIMTHELRTPLNGLIGPVEILSQTQLDDAQRSTLELVQSSAAVLRNLVDGVLDFSKIEAGLMELHPTATPVRGCLEDTLRVFRTMADVGHVALRLDVAEDVPETLELDTIRLQQTLMNLVGNAMKFTEDGHVTVAVAYDNALQALHVVVQDTGAGIPQSALAHVFEPFVQVESSSKRAVAGTGLGLAICARLVQLAGGDIQVESTLGKGTRFEFTWPAAGAKAAPARRVRRSSDEIRQLRVLVAEDEPVNQQVIRLMLSQLGITPLIVDNGPASVQAAGDYDVIFMDMRLPGLDGADAARAIRKGGRAKRPWIIAATANATEHDRAECLAAGMNDFITKPLELAQLVLALERADAQLRGNAEGPS